MRLAVVATTGCGGGEEEGAISATDKYDFSESGKKSTDAAGDTAPPRTGSSAPPTGRQPAEQPGGGISAPRASEPPPAGRPTDPAPPTAQGDPKTGSLAGVPKPPTAPPRPGDLAIPDGGPAEIIAFIEALQQQPPQGATRQEQLQNVRNVLLTSVQACERVLSAEASTELYRRAVELKLGALQALIQLGMPEAQGHIRKFCRELRKHPDAELARLGMTLDFGLLAEDYASKRETDFSKLETELAELLAMESFGGSQMATISQSALRLYQAGYPDESDKMLAQVQAGLAEPEEAVAEQIAALNEQLILLKSDLTQRIQTFAQSGREGETLVRSVATLLENPARGRGILAMSVQAADSLERRGRFDLAKELYGKVVAAYEKSEDPEIVKFSKRAMESSSVRMGLLGKPLTFEAKLLDGAPVNWEAYKNKVTLIYFWSARVSQNSAQIMRMELDTIQRARTEHPDEFAALAVNVDGDPELTRLMTKGSKWDNVSIDVAEEDQPVVKATGLGAVPYSILIDSNGLVQALHLGGPALAKAIEDMLQDDPPAAEPNAPETTEPAAGDGGDLRAAPQALRYVAHWTAGDDPAEADEQREAPNPYLAPKSASISDLVEFLFRMEEKPKTIRRRPGFAAAAAEAADRVLNDPKASKGQSRTAWEIKLRALHYGATWDDAQAETLLNEAIDAAPADPPASVAKLLGFLRLEQRALAADDLEVNKIPELVADVTQFFEQLGKDSGQSHLRLASAAVHAANRLEDADAREALFAKLGKSMSGSRDRELARYGAKLAKPASGAASGEALVGKPLELAGETALGGQLDWASYRGKVVLVDFWATWCGPCLREMPHVRALYDELHSKGFDIVAVSLDRDLDAVRTFLEDKNPPWTNVIGEATQELAQRYGVRAIPTMMLVDAKGRVVAVSHKSGDLADKARQLLGDPDK